MQNPYQPTPMYIARTVVETTDHSLKTLELIFSQDEDRERFFAEYRPGQFCQLSIFGKGEALERLSSLCQNEPDLMEIIAQAKKQSGVLYDFSMVHELSYYTGPVFEGYIDSSRERIISGGVYDQVRNRIEVDFQEMGYQNVKNVSAPILAYAIGKVVDITDTDSADSSDSIPENKKTRLPRVLVRPAQVAGENEELTDLVDGLHAAIIDSLTSSRALTVVRSNDSDVDFIIDGTARAAGQRIRLSFNLVDVAEDTQIWSERYDRIMDNVFELEDEISKAISLMIRVRLKDVDFKRLENSNIKDLSVPDLLSRAAGFFVNSRSPSDEIEPTLAEALEREPGNSMAHSMLAAYNNLLGEYTPLALPQKQIEKIDYHASRAVSLQTAAYYEHFVKGLVLSEIHNDFAGAKVHAEAALRFDSSHIQSQILGSIAKCHLGQLATGLAEVRQAVDGSIGQYDPNRYRHWREFAIALISSGMEKEAAEVMLRVTAEFPEMKRNMMVLAATLYLAGDEAKAKETMASLISAFPDLSVETVRRTNFGDAEIGARFFQALVDAGLPK